VDEDENTKLKVDALLRAYSIIRHDSSTYDILKIICISLSALIFIALFIIAIYSENANVVILNQSEYLQNIMKKYLDTNVDSFAIPLKEAGIVSVMDLAVTSAEQLAVDINSSKDSAAAFIMAAQKLLRESNV
jgi:hypothetical protein